MRSRCAFEALHTDVESGKKTGGGCLDKKGVGVEEGLEPSRSNSLLFESDGSAKSYSEAAFGDGPQVPSPASNW